MRTSSDFSRYSSLVAGLILLAMKRSGCGPRAASSRIACALVVVDDPLDAQLGRADDARPDADDDDEGDEDERDDAAPRGAR